jgi:hypothetical protein
MRQRDDVISDFDTVMFETVGPAGRLYVGPANELGGTLSIVESVARVAFLQSVKSKHNPRDATLVVLLGEGLPSDGFGDVTLVEAEDGRFPEQQAIVRPTASHNGAPPPEVTSVLLDEASLTGMIPGTRDGSNIAMVRYSLDHPDDSPATLTFNDTIEESLNLQSTQLPGLAVAEAWDFYKTAFGPEFQADGSTLRYSLSATLAEIDTLGVIHLGGELGLNQYDVNANGEVTALDALLIINFMQRNGGPLEIAPLGSRLNVNAHVDAMISAVDALQVINFMTRQQAFKPVPESVQVLTPQRITNQSGDLAADLRQEIADPVEPKKKTSSLSSDKHASVLHDLAILDLVEGFLETGITEHRSIEDSMFSNALSSLNRVSL